MRGYTRLKIFFLLMVLYSGTLYAQKTEGSLEVKKFAGSPEEVNVLLKKAKEDSAKVNLLIKLFSIEWRRSSGGKMKLDTCIYLGHQALTLSKQIGYNFGFTESTLLLCKAYLEKSDLVSATKVLNLTHGEQRARLLITFAEHYIWMPVSAHKSNLDTAQNYLKKAIETAQQAQSEKWNMESKLAMGKLYYAKGDIEGGKKFFFELIKYFQAKNDKGQEAFIWSEMAHYMPGIGKYHRQTLAYSQHAIDLNLSIGNLNQAASVMEDMAFDAFICNELDFAEKNYLKRITLLKAAHQEKFFTTYLALADIYKLKGNLNNALSYTLLALRNIEKLHQDIYLANVYASLGDIYGELGESQKSCDYYLLCMERPVDTSFGALKYFYTLRSLARGYIKQGKARQALRYSQYYLKRNPAKLTTSKEIAADIMALCYQGIKETKLAEKYFLQVLALDKQVWSETGRNSKVDYNIVGTEAYLDVANFYVSLNKFDSGDIYATKALSFPNVTPVMEMQLRYLKYRTDSATGNFQVALSSYRRANRLKDSISNDRQANQVNFLKIQFETVAKEKNIALLEKEAALRKKELQQTTQTKILAIGGVFILILLAAILFGLYSFKNEKNRQLQKQQNLINAKNASLEQLVGEKELLVKEIHHRVKNNLQTITSLLGSQLYASTDEQVNTALQDSLHRVQAMAMIHQKLYNTSNYNEVDMASYIEELVEHLSEVFNPGAGIEIKFNAEPIFLDFSVAVPIGLLINEALSNCIKHAFPGNQAGKISLIFRKTSSNEIELEIKDNGIGINNTPADNSSSHFGMRLIHGLAKEVKGKLIITGNGGTTINLQIPV